MSGYGSLKAYKKCREKYILRHCFLNTLKDISLQLETKKRKVKTVMQFRLKKGTKVLTLKGMQERIKRVKESLRPSFPRPI